MPNTLTYALVWNWVKSKGSLSIKELRVEAWLSTFLAHCT